MKNIGKAAVAAVAAGGAVTLGICGALIKHNIKRPRPMSVAQKGLEEGSDWAMNKPIITEGIQWYREQQKEEVSIQSFDGLKLYGDLFQAEKPNGRVVLMVHGFKSSGEREYGAMIPFLHEAGYDVLVVDDRAHGRSEGDYIGFGCLDREDCYQWIHYLNRRYKGKYDIFLHGVSMGGATVLMASELNLPPRVKGIVDDCGFTSPKAEMYHVMNASRYSYTSFILQISNRICQVLAGYGFEDCSAVEAVKNTKIPVFVIHGKADTFVPTYMGVKIYQACKSEKYIWLVNGAGHGESYYRKPEEYQRKVLEFFERCAGRTK